MQHLEEKPDTGYERGKYKIHLSKREKREAAEQKKQEETRALYADEVMKERSRISAVAEEEERDGDEFDLFGDTDKGTFDP